MKQSANGQWKKQKINVDRSNITKRVNCCGVKHH